jgi:RNA polymerase sigma-70 factor (ECF subfamily)
MRLRRRAQTHEVTEELVDLTGDADLVRAAQVDPRAFEPLYLRYRDRIINYCFYRLADRTDADDAASAVFLHALHALPAFQHHAGSFRPWLFTIAHNEVADRQKQRARHPETPFDSISGVATSERSPEELALTRDDRRYVLALLESLPPRERAVLELRVGELTTVEIALILGINEQAVRTAHCRALARMKELVRAADVSGQEVSHV